MKLRPNLILTFLSLSIGLLGCEQKKKDINWFTKETEYEGSPLHLRGPIYEDIETYKNLYPQLICVTHSLDSVTANGLPTSNYNQSLFDFDSEITDLFNENEGIFILVETYGGERNYWFHTISKNEIIQKLNNLKNRHPDKKLNVTSKNDANWNFIKQYPFKLY